jgi:N-acetylglutamate synthase-like GNAT family acetyltransferase
MADVTVRLATAQDVQQILLLIRSLVASHDEPLPSEEAMAAIVARQIETDNHEYVVAEAEGRVFACLLVCYYLSTWAAAPYAMLQDFIVQEGWRDKGVGSTMFAYARDRARLKGCARIDLIIQASRTDAKRFFRRWGFRTSDRQLMRMRVRHSRGDAT